MANDDGDPSSRALDVDPACIELYRSLLDESESRTASGAQRMVDLVESWRAHEHWEHLASVNAFRELDQVGRPVDDWPMLAVRREDTRAMWSVTSPTRRYRS